MYHVELFAGGCLGAVAHQRLLGHRTLLYVERDACCQRIIRARIRDGSLHDAPIWDDVRTLRVDNPECGEFLDAVRACRPLVVSGGFPCQPFSAAGKRGGADDERNCWPETVRILGELRPDFAFLENVPGLLSVGDGSANAGRYFGTVLGDLAAIGLDARWTVLSAADVGANHIRRRLWILAYAAGDGRLEGGTEPTGEQGGFDAAELREPVADAFGARLEERQGERSDAREELATVERGGGALPDADCLAAGRLSEALSPRQPEHGSGGWWAAEPDVGRVVDGSSSRVDRIGRLGALGNGQVPACVQAAWERLTGDFGDAAD